MSATAFSSGDGAAAGALTLALDASTYAGSVAVLRGASVVAEREVAMRGERAERMMPAVADALAAAGGGIAAVDRVVCGAGPGSFTSLRIAASIAKGVAQGRGVPLLAVSSLTLVVAGAADALLAGRYLVATDAMRGDWYAAMFELTPGGSVVERGAPGIVAGVDALRSLAAREAAVLVGPAWERPGGGPPLAPRAAGVARLLVAGDAAALLPVELASWEPSYGRLAEAQVKWEAAHGRALSPTSASSGG